MEKEFDRWNSNKKSIDIKSSLADFAERASGAVGESAVVGVDRAVVGSDARYILPVKTPIAYQTVC